MQANQIAARSFRLVLWRLWLIAAIGHLALLGAMYLAIHLAGKEADGLALALIGIMPAMYWVVYGLRFRLTVSQEGLAWYTMRGTACSLCWSQIQRAERNKEFGGLVTALKVWWIHEDTPWVVPLDVADRAWLCETVREFAGETHPVTVAITGRG